MAQVAKIEPDSLRREISAHARLMAGLRFQPNLIRQVFREDMMRESTIYQEILEEGRQEGELTLIVRQLARRVGSLDAKTEAKIRTLSLGQLEELGEALLDFSDLSDLNDWLQAQ